MMNRFRSHRTPADALDRSRMYRRARRVAVVCLLLAAGTGHNLTDAADRWPQFRGPTGDGITVDQSPPVTFDEQNHLTWRTEVAGKGWSSPVIADGLIWLTTAIERLPDEQERVELLRQTENAENKFDSLAIAASINLKLIALDLASGSVRHDIDLAQIEKPDAIHALNSYASPTPVIDGPSVLCHFGTFGTFCVARDDGAIVWTRRLPIKHAVGPGSSPYVIDDKLILIQDGMEQQYVMALDKATGQDVWRTDRPAMRATDGDMRKAYCTPIELVDSTGRRQLICMASQWMVSLDPDTGNELWRVDHGDGFSIVPRPVRWKDTVIFATGFGKPHLMSVDVTGSGDVTATHVRWTVKKSIPAKPSPLVLGDRIYLVDDNGVASCLDADSGDAVWQQRLGGKYSASPVFAGGLIYFANHEGEVVVVRPGDKLDKVAVNVLDGQIMASPAVVDDALIVRTDQAVYRFDP